jgi:hypothetical protein
VGELLLVGLTRLNIVLAAATALIAFSLLAYLFVFNFRDAVARAFVAVLALVTVVYVGDIFLATARLPAAHPAAAFWLQVEWIGIALVTPAYLHFSDALLLTTGDRSWRRRRAVRVSAGLAALALALVLTTELIVAGVTGPPGAVRFSPGRLFVPFALGYWALTFWGARNVWIARSRALTDRSRRRMSYLMVSIIAPMSIFPYLIAGGEPLAASPLAFRFVAATASLAIAAMTVIVAYGVAYHGALVPERAVKRELMKYLIQAPVLGVFLMALAELVPERLESSLGLPRNAVLLVVVMVGIVAFQLLVRLWKPAIDLLVYGRGGRDAMWLRHLDEQLLTEEDMQQLLENILAALCDRLRVGTGCMFIVADGGLRLEAHTGSPERLQALLAALEPQALAVSTPEGVFVVAGEFAVRPLRPPGGGSPLGLLAIEDPARRLMPEEEAAFRSLVGSAERALADRLVQQRVLGALREIEPELQGMQRLRGVLETGRAEDIAELTTSPIDSPDFPHWVKDALTHYWGGPKLTESPLLGLNVVRQALAENDYNAAKAMRAVLDNALETLKPEGERSLTASRWLVYNILELRFVRGMRVRDIATRLAMSESDLYRKQRVAIEALAQQLAAMEQAPEVQANGTGTTREGAGAGR